MGRYYTGDIEGKFWVAVQSSDDADFFGSVGNEPNYLEYYFDKTNLPEISQGIKMCKNVLGKHKSKLDKFFKKGFGYNDEQIMKALESKKDNTKLNMEDIRKILEWYARLGLGETIKKCVKKKGECNFTAEL